MDKPTVASPESDKSQSPEDEDRRSFREVHKLWTQYPVMMQPFSTPKTKHFGIPWNFEWGVQHQKIYVKLNCDMGMHSNLWSVDYKFTAILRVSAADEGTMSSISGTFDHQNPTACLFDLAAVPFIHQDIMAAYFTVSQFTLDLTVEVLKTTGISRKRKFNEQPELQSFHDVTLLVDGETFRESKAFLASFSPVFARMFSGKFKEASSAEIPLEEVSAGVFEQFLNILHSFQTDIDEENCEEILEFADRYDVQKVIRKVLKYVKQSRNVPVAKKLQIAEQYQDAELQQIALDSLLTREDIEPLTRNMDQLSEVTAKALLRKSLTLWN